VTTTNTDMSNTPQTNLSPAAAAVRAAYSEGCYLLMPHRKHQLDGMACPGLAAALLAAADRVVPSETASLSKWPERHEIRRQLLAIAAELREAAQ